MLLKIYNKKKRKEKYLNFNNVFEREIPFPIIIIMKKERKKVRKN